MLTTWTRLYKQAIDAGGTEVKPLQDQFYGDRSGTLTDPFGHVWTVATHKEDVTPEEIEKRLAAGPRRLAKISHKEAQKLK